MSSAISISAPDPATHRRATPIVPRTGIAASGRLSPCLGRALSQLKPVAPSLGSGARSRPISTASGRDRSYWPIPPTNSPRRQQFLLTQPGERRALAGHQYHSFARLSISLRAILPVHIQNPAAAARSCRIAGLHDDEGNAGEAARGDRILTPNGTVTITGLTLRAGRLIDVLDFR